MKINEQIRALYQPIQPTIKSSEGEVTYREFMPSIFLQEFIYCYWQLKTKQKLSDQFNYKVVADGCMDVFFELNNPKANFVMGFCKEYTEFPLADEFNYVGIRFLPTMFPQLFDINASDLSNRFEHLASVVPQIATFIEENFHGELTETEIQGKLDDYFTKMISKLDFKVDHRLYNALEIILSNYGVLNIEKDLDIGISSR